METALTLASTDAGFAPQRFDEALVDANAPKQQYGNVAYDLAGRAHDIGEMRERRNTAIAKGLRRMHKFFRKNDFSALYEIGDDAPSIFFECWYTSANSSIRMLSKGICKQLMPKYETFLLEGCGAPPPLPGGGPSNASANASSGAASRGRRAAHDLTGAVPPPIAPAKGGRARMRIAQVVADSQAASAKGADDKGTTNKAANAKGASAGSRRGSGGVREAAQAPSSQTSTPASKGAVNKLLSVMADSRRGAGTRATRVPPKKAVGAARRKGAAREKTRSGRPDRDDFFAIMFLARCKQEMDEDVDELLRMADVAWRINDFADTDKLFGYQKSKLGGVGTDDWLMLLMRIMIMEFNGLLFAKRYRLQWGLKEALMALRALELAPPPKPGEPFNNDFHHSFYLATHIVYVQSAYNAIKASEREIPWLYRYVRKSFRYWMRMVKEYKKDNTTYVDIDGIAEVCDCLRGAGLTEASDPMLCEGTLYLLKMQRKNGMWPAVLFGDDTPESSLDPYHRIHPTWVCTQALRDRDFKIGAGANMFWPEFVAKVIKESQFQTLLYKPGW